MSFLLRSVIVFLLSSVSLFAKQWSVEQAEAWAKKQGWYAGFNYVPSYAVNTIEQWQEGDFDAEIIERELGWGHDLGYRAVRVFIPFVLWQDDAQALHRNFETFLKLCQAKDIRVVPVLFDDCAYGYPPQLAGKPGPQREPQPGVILSSWVPSPGLSISYDEEGVAQIKAYLQDWLTRYGQDERILFWDLFNEPLNEAGVGTPELLQMLFAEAWAVRPSQPLTVGVWSGDISVNSILFTHSDILSFHTYTGKGQLQLQLAFYAGQGRPSVCSEWFARPQGSHFESDLPLFYRAKIPCFQWGLVNGRTQAQFPWKNKPGDPVAPEGWFHDLLHADGKSYRAEETDFIQAFLADPSAASEK